MIAGPLFFASMALARVVRGRGYGESWNATGTAERPSHQTKPGRPVAPIPASHFANVPEPVEPDRAPRRVEVKKATSAAQAATPANPSLSPAERRLKERREWWARQRQVSA